MIYSASLGVPAKKVLAKQVVQSNINKIAQNLKLSPETTSMDVVILSPKDFIGPKGTMLSSAIANAHRDICIIYLYIKDEDSDLANTQYSKKYKKGKEGIAIREAVEEFVGQHKIITGGQQLSSADFETPVTDNIPDMSGGTATDNVYSGNEGSSWEPMMYETPVPAPAPTPIVGDEPEPVAEVPQVNFENPSEFDIPPLDESLYTQPEVKPMDTHPEIDAFTNPSTDTAPTVDTVLPASNKTIEEYLAKINSYEDWSIFKENLKRDSIVKHLIEENSEYQGLINMLDVLDKRIETVWRDTTLSPDQKFDKIKEIGLERSVVRAAENSINVEKVISIISTIILSAKRTVDEKVSSINSAMYKLTVDKSALMNTTELDKLIDSRSKIQLELMCIGRELLDLWMSCEQLVSSEIKSLDEKLPSSNAFINNMVKPIGTQIFTPTNTAELVDKLMRALQEQKIVASRLEETVNSLIVTLFSLCEQDEKIIHRQQELLNLFMANHVEDVVIVNSLLKNCLRLYTGAENTGRSATAIIHSGVLSRTANTLLIDLSGSAKFRQYGIVPMTLDDFMNTRVEEHFLCVEAAEIPSPDELQVIVDTLKSRLNYYQFVNVILKPEDEILIDQLSTDAKTIFYVTDCTPYSISTMKKLIDKHKTVNIAREVVMIDAPDSPLTICDRLGVDPTITKLVMLPSIKAIRSCSLKHDRPYEYNDVARIFEEAFR